MEYTKVSSSQAGLSPDVWFIVCKWYESAFMVKEPEMAFWNQNIVAETNWSKLKKIDNGCV